MLALAKLTGVAPWGSNGGIVRLYYKQQLREFVNTFGKSTRQHAIRDKSKEDTGHLPNQISFCTQSREPGSEVTTTWLLGGPNPAENHGPCNQQSHLQYEVLFSSQEVLAVKYTRRREQPSFFLAVLLKDRLVRSRTIIEQEFAEDTVDLLCEDNSNRSLALRSHVTSFLWKWKLHDFAFETLSVGHLLNKIIVIWFFKPAPFA